MTHSIELAVAIHGVLRPHPALTIPTSPYQPNASRSAPRTFLLLQPPTPRQRKEQPQLERGHSLWPAHAAGGDERICCTPLRLQVASWLRGRASPRLRSATPSCTSNEPLSSTCPSPAPAHAAPGFDRSCWLRKRQRHASQRRNPTDRTAAPSSPSLPPNVQGQLSEGGSSNPCEDTGTAEDLA